MKPNGLPSDTSPAAAAVQFDVLRKIGPQARIKMVFELSNRMREIALAGIRRRRPEYTDDMAQLALFRLTLGEELFRRVFPGREVTA